MRSLKCSTIAMLEINSNFYREYQTTNKGVILSARIYASERCTVCHVCGGKFDATREIERVKYPVCSTCGSTPNRLRIRAKIISDNRQKQIDIRFDKMGRRLTSLIDCMALLKQVEVEIAMGTFEVKRIETKRKREEYLFENVVAKYLKEVDDRFEAGEIKFYTHKNYHKYAKVLLRYFSGRDIASINKDAVDEFRRSDEFKNGKNHTNKNQGHALLKTIMGWAKDKKIIRDFEDLGKSESTKTREKLIDAKLGRKIVSLIKNNVLKEAITVMFDYALRPNEVRALQIWDIDLDANIVHIRRSFSGPVLSADYERKSTKKGGIGSLEFPLSQHLKDFVIKQLTTRGLSTDSREPLFTLTGDYLGEKAMSDEWKKTLDENGIAYHQLYELRGSRGSEIYEATGDIALVSEYLGHTNISTTQKRYNRGKRDKSKFIDVAK